MKSVLFTIIMAAFGFAFAEATEDNPMNIQPIVGGEFFCSTAKELGFVFNITGKRMWFTEKGETIGIEFEVKDVVPAKCPGCYDITAKGMGADLQFFISQNGPKTYELNGTAKSKDIKGNDKVDQLKSSCEKL